MCDFTAKVAKLWLTFYGYAKLITLCNFSWPLWSK